MNYTQTVDWLYSKLPMFQQTGASAYKKDLTNILKLTSHLENPQNKYPTIHIAGTNGKGSSSHMLASILQEAGYKVGLTTSPHLKDFRERIRVNGEMCSEQFVIDFIHDNHNFIENLNASFFEVSVAMAFDYFEKEKVDIAIIETGLGGRLDSTNVITPILSIITNIGLDHTKILGNTRQEIATEKAGIIKNRVPVIIGESDEEINAIFIEKAHSAQSELIFAEHNSFPDYISDLKGLYQQKNKRTVLTAIQKINELGFSIPKFAVKNGLQKVIANTRLRGRWDVLQTQPMVVADTAHNPHGLKEVVRQIQQAPYENLHLVLGFVNDKDVKSILSFFPEDAIYYFSAPNVLRKLAIDELKKIIPKNLNATYFKNVVTALEVAKSNAKKGDLIYIGGSTFVVAEVI
ncbi:MAG: bifunctional folylpolyglutamate synthase/dihydrofolate synthase [Moheibacter sp.]